MNHNQIITDALDQAIRKVIREALTQSLAEHLNTIGVTPNIVTQPQAPPDGTLHDTDLWDDDVFVLGIKIIGTPTITLVDDSGQPATVGGSGRIGSHPEGEDRGGYVVYWDFNGDSAYFDETAWGWVSV